MKVRLIKKSGIKFSNKNKILLILIILIFSLLLTFRFINKKIYPTLISYATSEIKKISSILINNAITKEFSDINVDDLFITTKDSNGQIKSMDFNPIIVNKALSSLTISIQNDLKELEKGNLKKLNMSNYLSNNYKTEKLKDGIIFEIPTGMAFNNALLANLGPKIPVRINLIGNILSNVNTNLTNYGINSALVEVVIHIEVELEVLIPFSSGQIIVTSDVPVAMKLVQGNVPNYYVNGDKNSSSLMIPVE